MADGRTQRADPPDGLRARKRRETRRRIAEAGLRLFLENGFEATTLDAVAAAADISRRTFFHHFDGKEDILLAWESGMEDAFRAALAAAAPTEAPLQAVCNALSDVVSRYETDQAIAIDRLMRSTPALRARKQANYERQERVVFEILAERWPNGERRPALRLVAMVGVGALRLAAEAWSGEGGRRPLADYLHDAFARLRAETAA